MRNKRFAAILTSILLTAGISLAGQAQSSSSTYDCSNARSHLNRLHHEKDAAEQRKAAGVSQIMPINIGASILAGKQTTVVDIDPYIDSLTQAMVKIVTLCGVPD